MRILLIVNKVALHAVETRHATKDLGNKLGRQAGRQLRLLLAMKCT